MSTATGKTRERIQKLNEMFFQDIPPKKNAHPSVPKRLSCGEKVLEGGSAGRALASFHRTKG